MAHLEEDLTKNESEYWIRSDTENKKLNDEYLLGDVIGRGASSIVYKCLRKGRTEWACKIIKKEQLNKKSFQADIHKLMKLKHPNLVQIKEVFETHDEIHLILELAYGGELFERIVERGHYTEEDAAQAVRHILKALQYLHSNGVIHRDLKPENLLYQTQMEESVLKLTDFGISKLLSNEPLAISKACGTFGYCAPEILLHKDFDSSVDLWSLGVVTYIMLCGFEPFWDEGGTLTIYNRIIEGDYSFPSPWWDEISDSAKELISKLLSVDPKSRPTAEEALNHPWTLGISTSSFHMNDTILRLREFNARRRFRVATQAVIATRRALNFLSPSKKCTKDNSSCFCRNTEDVEVIRDESTNNSSDSKCCDCSLSSVAVSDPSLEDSLSLLSPIDGKPIRTQTCLSPQYKESYVGMS